LQYNNSGAFGGGTGTSWVNSSGLLTIPILALGSTAATTGDLRFNNAALVEARNAANSANLEYLSFNNGNLEINRNAATNGSGVQIGTFGRTGFGTANSGGTSMINIAVNGSITTALFLSDLSSKYGAMTLDLGGTVGGGMTLASGGSIAFAPTGGSYTSILSSTALRLGIPASSAVALELASTGTAFTQKIQAADSPASFIVYKLPTADPVVDQHLDVVTFSGGIATTAWTNTIKQPGAFGELIQIVTNSESITLSTSATFTDSSTNILPANSLILDCSSRVLSSITGLSPGQYEIGTASSATRFLGLTNFITAGSTAIGISQWGGTVAPIQTAAGTVRITVTGGTPTGGAVRVTCRALTFTAPTS
jgi:hypothetical protein